MLASSDDGASWLPILSFEGGAQQGQLVEVGGLAVDPADSTRLWVGLNRSASSVTPRTFAGEVTFSADGGQTWSHLGGGLPSIHDLALGIDGQNLYAATDNGVYRLRLTDPNGTRDSALGSSTSSLDDGAVLEIR